MTTAVRPYRHPDNFEAVGQFLISTYRTGVGHRNWLQPRWEYMLYHPMLQGEYLDRIGLWEETGEIVAAIHFEDRPGTTYFEVAPGYAHLKKEMVEYAEIHLVGQEDGERFLQFFVDRTDAELEALLGEMGYEKKPEWAEPMSMLTIPDPFPVCEVPPPPYASTSP